MRHHIITVMAAAIAATAVSFALAQADPPATPSASSTDRQILSELVRLNRSVGLSRRFGMRRELPAALDRQTGLLVAELEEQTSAIGRMCRALTDEFYNCPPAF